MEAWNFFAVTQVGDAGGAKWQSEHSCGTARVVVGAPLLQSTASCFISPVAGERRASTGPTNPAGAEPAWQSMQVAGCVASDDAEWAKLPPTQFCVPPHAPVPGPAWQVAQSSPAPCVAKSNGALRQALLTQPVVDFGRSPS